MAQLISAKGSDVLAWRAAGDFAATFRQKVLGRLEYCRSGEAADLLDGVVGALADLSASNDAHCDRCTALIEELAACDDAAQLKGLTTTYYAGLYAHLSVHRSAPAFYQFSTLYLQALARSVSRSALRRLGRSARSMPGMALVALGPAGRQEFSPFCPLHIILVHGHTAAADDGHISRFAEYVHEGIQASGLRLDADITPRNPKWRGSLHEWEQRLEANLKPGMTTEVADLLRLADQTCLAAPDETGSGFRQMSLANLSASTTAVGSLVSRVTSFSNGIGLIGRLRLEKDGPYRGHFALLEHALQPLAASVSVLSLLKSLETVTTPRRIRELLWRRELDVDMAERLLQAWHSLHELRLDRELGLNPDWSDAAPLHVPVGELNAAGLESLRESLDAVGTIQRHIGLNFSGMEG